MTPEEFQRFCEDIVADVKKRSPIDTGNLRYNGIRYEYIDENTCEIYVDESIVPYIYYTNEPWISPKWNGKKNPNEAWWQRAAEAVALLAADKLNGKVL